MIQIQKQLGSTCIKDSTKFHHLKYDHIKKVKFGSSVDTTSTNPHNKSSKEDSELKTTLTEDIESVSSSDEEDYTKRCTYNCRINTKDFGSLSGSYKIKKCLGKGSYGFVYQVKSKIDKNTYAIKVINKKKGKCPHLYNEVQTAAKLACFESYQHNLVKYFSSWERDEVLYIKTECCADSLGNIIRERKHKFSEIEIRKLIRDIMNAIMFMHKKNIVHLDVKPDNIYKRRKVDFQTKKVEYEWVLGDFSLSNEIDQISQDDNFLGEGKYLSPEAIYCDDPHEVDLKKVDLFAFGRSQVEVLLCKMISTNVESEQRQLLKTKEGILTVLEDCRYSQRLIDFIIMLNSPKAENRVYYNQHKVFKNMFRYEIENEKVWLKHIRKFYDNQIVEYEKTLENPQNQNSQKIEKIRSNSI